MFGKIIPENGNEEGSFGCYHRGDIAFVTSTASRSRFTRPHFNADVATKGIGFSIGLEEVKPFNNYIERDQAVLKMIAYLEEQCPSHIAEFKEHLITLKIGE